MANPPDGSPDWGIRKYAAGQLLAAAPLVRFWHTLRLIYSHTLFGALYLGLVLLLIISSWAALATQDNSPWRSFFVDASAGLFVFLIAPPLVVAALKWGANAYYWILGACALLFISAVVSRDLWQQASYALAIGLLLLIVLDLVFRSLEAAIIKMRDEVKADQADHDQAVDGAEDEFEPQFGGPNSGNLEETVAVERIERFHAILKELASPEGAKDDDAIEIVRAVNQMKRENPEEFARLEGYAEWARSLRET